MCCVMRKKGFLDIANKKNMNCFFNGRQQPVLFTQDQLREMLQIHILFSPKI